MKANYFIMTLMLLFLGCTFKKEIQHRKELYPAVCEIFFASLTKNWEYNKENKTYGWRNGMTLDEFKDVVRGTSSCEGNEKMGCVSCIKGLSPQTIEKLLGTPTKKTKRLWMYCSCYPCFGEGGLRNNCYFGVQFDTLTNKAKEFRVR